MTRSHFLQATAAGALGVSLGATEPAHAKPEAVRNRFWMWSHAAGVYDGMFGLPRNSRIHAVEAAEYLGTPNVVFVRAFEKPATPFEEFAQRFRDVPELQWSITGDSGATSADERDHVLRLARTMPNMNGVYMDDFFKVTKDGLKASMTIEEVQGIRDRLVVGDRRLDLGVVVYTKEKFNADMVPFLRLCDRISLWTWASEELAELEDNFATLAEVAPGKRLQMGCYMWDYGAQQPMPLDRMERQCELGLKWIEEKRISDMIFCGAHLCDQDLEAVDWTRAWIEKVGDQPL
ncbi:MAG: hypothetical protein GY851_28210 [bacterium]|nr:hypothetical protein [bacterium]